MAEPDVALTDYGLAIECAIFLYLLSSRMSNSSLRWWFLVLFGSLGLAAFIGGTVHGFFPNPESAGQRILWPFTLVLIGLTALAAWAVGAHLMLPAGVALWVIRAAVCEFAIYSAFVVFVSQAFLVAAFNYLPAVGFMFLALFLEWRCTRSHFLVLGLIGLGLTLLATGLREARVAIHPAYFDHNALYHVVQAFALLLIYFAARSLSTLKKPYGRVPC